MSGEVCPACGVAVLPGYVRCPKCRRALPKRPGTVQGGTAIEEPARRWPLFAAIGGVVAAVAIIVYLAGGDDEPTAAAPVQAPETQPAPTANQVDTSQPTFTDPQPTTQPTGPDPGTVAATLENDLKRQRLWSKVTVTGDRVEVRSGSCADPAMAPILDSVGPAFKAAGLTKLRCVEQSGRVVTDRDL